MSANTMTKRVSSIKSSSTLSKNLRTTVERRNYACTLALTSWSSWREQGRVWPPARGKKRRSWKNRVVRENEGVRGTREKRQE